MLKWLRTLISNYRGNTLLDKWGEVIKQEKEVWGETFYTVFSQGYNAGRAGIEFEKAWVTIKTLLGIEYTPKKKEEK